WTSFVPFYALSVAIFFVAERYRLPLFIPLAVLGGGAVDGLLHGWADSSRVEWKPMAALVLGGVITALPFQLDDCRFEERLRLSKVLMTGGDYSGAAREPQAAHDLRPTDAITEFNLGVAQVSAQRPAEGISHLRRAVDAGVQVPGARYVIVGAM